MVSSLLCKAAFIAHVAAIASACNFVLGDYIISHLFICSWFIKIWGGSVAQLALNLYNIIIHLLEKF